MPVEDERTYDIFISYSRHDEAFVGFLKRCLQLAGLRCFEDKTSLDVYERLDDALKKAVFESKWLMAVISPAYLQSYWCMFEALEAIEGQDLRQRFLPVVLRNSAADQVFDQSFASRALKEVSDQIKIFNDQTMAGNELVAPNVDKLTFVQKTLPKVFKQLDERVYPRFDLWDETSVRAVMRKFLNHVAEEAVVDLNAVKYDVQPSQAMPTVAARLSSLPVLVWKAEVGCQAWKNNALPVGNDVLVASSGRVWNEPDDMDGIYCLHAETGKTRWFSPTPADANRLMVSKGLVLAGCDDGSVVAVALHDGARQWCVQLDSAVVGGPFRLPANVADGLAIGQHNATEPILVVTWEGNLHILDQVTGRTVRSLSLGTPVIGTPVLLPGGAGVVVPSCDGQVHLIDYSDISIAFEGTRALTVAAHDLGDDPDNTTASVELAAQPCLAGSLILQGLVRDTYYADPPLVAIDSRTMKLQWVARAGDDPTEFGNLRGSPAIVGREAILVPAYCRGLCAVSLQTGQTSWTLDLSQEMFEQWSAPVAMGRSILIGRHDGYLHKVSCERRRREWSLYLGEHAQAGTVVAGSQAAPEFSDSSAWAAGSSSPILATPTLDRGRLYVGTHEGWLYCISNLGSDDPDF